MKTAGLPVRRLHFLAFLSLLAALAALSSAPAGSARSAGDPGPAQIVVGSVASLTGSAAPYGRSQLRGTRLAVAALNRTRKRGEPRLLLRSTDDHSTAAGGAAAVRRLLRSPGSALVGPTLSPVAEAADPLAAARRMPVLAASNTTLDISHLKTVWRVTLSERAMIPEALAAMRRRSGARRVALLVDSGDGYATGAAAVFAGAVKRQGLELTGHADFTTAAADVGSAVTALLDGNPQALLVAARGDSAIAALKAIRASAPTIPIVGGNGFNSEEVLTGAGAAADGVVVAASWNRELSYPRSRAFVRAFRDRFGSTPDAFAAQGYASLEILAAAARSGGTTPVAIQRGLRRVGRIETVLGSLRFSHGREARYPATVQVVRDGRFVPLPQRFSLVGRWSGRLRQPGLAPFRVWALIESPEGRAGNRVRYSGLNCRGSWAALPRTGSAYRFREQITSGSSETCKGVGTVTLRRTENPNTLRYSFHGGGVHSTGLLRRR
jgi:branched-chain amino acid transport system substrate-binding protein